MKPGPVPEFRAQRVLVVAREVPHHLLEVEAEVVAALVNGKVLCLGHTPESLGGTAPRPL